MGVKCTHYKLCSVQSKLVAELRLVAFSTILGYETLFRTSLWHMTPCYCFLCRIFHREINCYLGVNWFVYRFWFTGLMMPIPWDGRKIKISTLTNRGRVLQTSLFDIFWYLVNFPTPSELPYRVIHWFNAKIVYFFHWLSYYTIMNKINQLKACYQISYSGCFEKWPFLHLFVACLCYKSTFPPKDFNWYHFGMKWEQL